MILGENGEKMSKSRGNVLNPDSIVKEYGADSLRLYEMYMGPLEDPKPWSMQDVNGVHNFLGRVWRLIIDDHAEKMALNAAVVDRPPTDDENRMLHRTIEAVTSDLAKLKFNTAIARMMEFTNFFTKLADRPRAALEKFVLLLSPFAPHMAEELWQALGHAETLAYEPWPKFDPALAARGYNRDSGSDQRQGAVQTRRADRNRRQGPRSRCPCRRPNRRAPRRQTSCQSDRRPRQVGKLCDQRIS